MKDTDFIFGSTRIAIFEKSLITDPQWYRLIEAEDLKETLKILEETRYTAYLTDLQNGDIEGALSKELRHQAELMREAGSNETLLRLMHLKYDYHNLKILLKTELLGEDMTSLLYRFGDAYIPGLQEIIRHPQKNAKETPMEQAIDEAIQAYRENEDAQEIDIIVDRWYFEDMRQLSDEVGSDYFSKYTEDLIDFTNVDIYLRSRKQGRNAAFMRNALIDHGTLHPDKIQESYRLDEESFSNVLADADVSDALQKAYQQYLEDGSIVRFERAREEHQIDLAKEGLEALYGPEVIFGYGVRVETEIQNLRILLLGKKNNLTPNQIRERMRGLNA